MATFTKAITLLESLAAELKGLKKEYGAVDISTLLKAFGKGSAKVAGRRGRPPGRPKMGTKKSKGPKGDTLSMDQTLDLLKQFKTAAADKSKYKNVSAIVKASGLAPIFINDAQSGKAPKRGMQMKTAKKVCKFLGIDVPKAAAPKPTMPSGKKRGRPAKK